MNDQHEEELLKGAAVVFLVIVVVCLLLTTIAPGCVSLQAHNRRMLVREVKRSMVCFKHKGRCFCATHPSHPVPVKCQ